MHIILWVGLILLNIFNLFQSKIHKRIKLDLKEQRPQRLEDIGSRMKIFLVLEPGKVHF